MKEQRITGAGWTKIIIKFMLEPHVNEWKYRCNLYFQGKSSDHNNEFMSFYKRALLIIAEYIS